MIIGKRLDDGTCAFGVACSEALVKLVEGDNLSEGDVIDVFGGTVQVVVRNGIPAQGKRNYDVVTATKNDRDELEIITYNLRFEEHSGKLINMSKRPLDLGSEVDEDYKARFQGALKAA
jgi:hypothetical protein